MLEHPQEKKESKTMKTKKTATVKKAVEANSLDEIRAQCAAVREGLLDGSMSHHVGLSISKAVIAEAKMIQEIRKITELRLKHAPDGTVDINLLEG